MNRIVISALAAAVLLAATPPSSAQSAPPATSMPMSMPMPAASAAMLPHLTLGPDSLAGLPRRTVTVTEENGASATYSGVDLDALLVRSGAPHGMGLRGKAAADYVVAIATDGYRVVYALAELDPVLTDKVVIVADMRDGAPLDAKFGPFELIAPGEKHHLRWIHNVREIDVEAAP